MHDFTNICIAHFPSLANIFELVHDAGKNTGLNGS